MPADRPNLLFIYTDEQRADTLAAYGNTTIDMPNINRLSERSTVFERAYVSQPVCTPSRSTLLTGLWPHTNTCTTNNTPLPDDIKCFPEMVGADYRTAHHGKWHLGDEIYSQHGFQEWRAIEDLYLPHYSENRDRNDRSHYHHWLVSKGHTPDAPNNCFSRNYCTKLADEESKPAFLAEEASSFIRNNRDEPFVLYVNFLEPHMPFNSCRDDQYDRASVQLPLNLNDTESTTLREKLVAARFSHEFADEAYWRDLIARYWGLCSQVDMHVGMILEALESCDLMDNTIIVYTSDHGDMMGSHRLLTKGVMLEEAVRVPFMIALPGQNEHRRVESPVSQIDVVPTLLELMNQPAPECLQGQSLVPALHGTEPEDDVIIEWTGAMGCDSILKNPEVYEQVAGVASAEQVDSLVTDPLRTVITKDLWKLTASQNGEDRLYNLADDPLETHNLFKAPACRERIKEMRGRLNTWQQRVADTIQSSVSPDTSCEEEA